MSNEVDYAMRAAMLQEDGSLWNEELWQAPQVRQPQPLPPASGRARPPSRSTTFAALVRRRRQGDRVERALQLHHIA